MYISIHAYITVAIPSAELGQSTTAVEFASVHGQYKLHTESSSALQPSSNVIEVNAEPIPYNANCSRWKTFAVFAD